MEPYWMLPWSCRLIYQGQTEEKTIDEVQGMLVPHIHELDYVDISDVCWILVMEKEVSRLR